MKSSSWMWVYILTRCRWERGILRSSILGRVFGKGWGLVCRLACFFSRVAHCCCKVGFHGSGFGPQAPTTLPVWPISPWRPLVPSKVPPNALHTIPSTAHHLSCKPSVLFPEEYRHVHQNCIAFFVVNSSTLLFNYVHLTSLAKLVFQVTRNFFKPQCPGTLSFQRGKK